MTIFDETLQFSKAQAVTVTAASTNTIDLGKPGRVLGNKADMQLDVGPGYPLQLHVSVVETFATLTSLEIEIQSSPTTSFGSTGLRTVSLGKFARSILLAGKQTPFNIMPNDLNNRYIRLRYVVTGTTATAGKITAGIVASVEQL